MRLKPSPGTVIPPLLSGDNICNRGFVVFYFFQDLIEIILTHSIKPCLTFGAGIKKVMLAIVYINGEKDCEASSHKIFSR